MKRKVIFGVVITVLICVYIALNAKILEPKDFTGAWYRAGFVVDNQAVSEVVELYLVHKSAGDVFCERKDGNEIVWFCRNGESIDS